MNKYIIPLIKNERLVPGSYLHTYENAEIAQSARAGEFINILPGPGHDPLLRRPFSICTADREAGTFTALIKVVGPGTRMLAEMGPGTMVDMLAPLGLHFEWRGAKKMLLVAGGVGVAPLLLLSQEVREWTAQNRGQSPPEIIFCYGARSAGEFVLLDQIRPLVDQLVLTTDDGSLGTKEFCTAAAERFFEPGISIFTCGPNPMMNDLLKRMRKGGLEGQVSLENQMGCGIGACQGCVVTTRRGFRRICCEGPVLPTEELEAIGW
ncbi:dihydroorotate dehydrogenase electron transfer subunit [Candidatus Sumerlaeota bacterium]|nr:dihydroorotate dehydrogenase electron transfer subunit [Candidatus Sumerlaeota bacterium]